MESINKRKEKNLPLGLLAYFFAIMPEEKTERRLCMALTRRALKAMGIDEEKIDEIIALHTETVDGLKAEITKASEDSEKLSEVQKELEKVKSESSKKDDWKDKYEDLQKQYDSYKSEQEAKAVHTAKETAYKELLKSAGVSEKRISTILKVTDVDELELDEDGTAKDSDKLTEGIRNEWSDFIVSQETVGADTSTPPANNPPAGKETSRAAQIAAEYHQNLYGKETE